jgi:hypothetical protein
MTKSKTETVNIKVPKRLERDIEAYNGKRTKLKSSDNRTQKSLKIKQKSVGHPNLGVPLNRSLPKRSYDKIHGVKMDRESMTVVGSALIDMVRTAGNTGEGALTEQGNCYINFRKFVHPSTILSRRLKNFSANYSKYKFKRFNLYFVGAKSATDSTYVTTAFTKDLNIMSPFPGISLKSYVSELHDEKSVKVFDEGRLPSMDIAKDARSFYITLGVGDLEDTFQGQLIVVLTGAEPEKYYGDLHVDYEIEFSNENVEPVNMTFRNAFDISASGSAVTFDSKVLSWTSTASDQITFYGPRQGIWACTLAEYSWLPFDNTEMSKRNWYGSGFFLSIQGVMSSGLLTNYSAIRFTIYPNYAAVIDANPLDYTGTLVQEQLTVFMQQVSDTDPLIVAGEQITHEDHCGMPLGIGIGVGPGVLAGEPDIVPSIGINHGRLVLPSPVRSVRR